MAKINHEGKRYDTSKCIDLGKRNLYSHSNNYAGTRRLMVASDGAYLIEQTSNGQDCYIVDYVEVVDRQAAIEELDGMDQNEAQEAAAIKCGLIELVA